MIRKIASTIRAGRGGLDGCLVDVQNRSRHAGFAIDRRIVVMTGPSALQRSIRPETARLGLGLQTKHTTAGVEVACVGRDHAHAVEVVGLQPGHGDGRLDTGQLADLDAIDLDEVPDRGRLTVGPGPMQGDGVGLDASQGDVGCDGHLQAEDADELGQRLGEDLPGSVKQPGRTQVGSASS